MNELQICMYTYSTLVKQKLLIQEQITLYVFKELFNNFKEPENSVWF